MMINTTLLGLMALASAVAALPEAEAQVPSVGSLIKVKRAAFAVNDILKRHAENEPECSQPLSYCEKQRSSLDGIAEVTLDGYDEAVRREAAAEADPKWKNYKYFWSFCGAPGSMCDRKRTADVEEEQQTQDLVSHCSKPGSFCAAKRTAEPEEHHIMKRCAGCDFLDCDAATKDFCKKIKQQKWHQKHPHYWKNHPHKHPHKHYGAINPKTGQMKNPNNKGQHKQFWPFCGAPGSMCDRKRDAHPQDAAEASAFDDTLYAIRDAVNTIKREADEGEELAGGSDGPSSDIDPYFDDIERRVNDAIASMDD